MKHSNTYKQFYALHIQELRELGAAVMAHGGVYRFDGANADYPPPIVAGARKHDEHCYDFYIDRVEVVGDSDFVEIYGYQVEGWHDEVEQLHDIEFGHVGFIIDAIPETELVTDVTETP